jgi:hypothetical protein
MSRPEAYVSLDIEGNGPAPGINSMLAIGAALYTDEQKGEAGTFYSTLYPMVRANENPETMAWWKTQPEAWDEVNKNRQPPYSAIPSFVEWLEKYNRFNLIAVGWPIAFDFAYVNYYCHRFAGRNPLGFAGLDIRSFANGILGFPDYYGLPEASIRRLAGPIDTDGLRPHVAVDDAIEQGRLFMALRKIAQNRTANKLASR